MLWKGNKFLDLSALIERFLASVGLQVDQVLTVLATNEQDMVRVANTKYPLQDTHPSVLNVCMAAWSRSKVPSALVKDARLGRSMRMPSSWMTGLADATRARATVNKLALQNMVKSNEGPGGEGTGVLKCETGEPGEDNTSRTGTLYTLLRRRVTDTEHNHEP